MAKDVRTLVNRLDWKAYFLKFCERHGEPVVFKGQLLFRDGWRYSSSDYSGPEVPPPADPVEHDALTVEYWKTRRRELTGKLLKVRNSLEVLRGIAESRSMPLQEHMRVSTEDETGKRVVRNGYRNFDFRALTDKVRWIQDDIDQCDRELDELARYPERYAALLSLWEEVNKPKQTEESTNGGTTEVREAGAGQQPPPAG